MFDKECQKVLIILISILIAILIGILYFFELIGEIFEPIIFAIIFAAVSLIITYITAMCSKKYENNKCICRYGVLLILSGFMTLLFGLIFLAIPIIDLTLIFSSILIGIASFFFVLNIFATLGLFLCTILYICYRNCEIDF